MKTTIFRAGVKLILLNIVVFFTNASPANTITSVMSGNYDAPATWDGGTAPNLIDSVVIASGHTVTLTANTKVLNLAIQSGAVFNNAAFDLTLYNYLTNSSYYTNNGTHQSSGGKLYVSTSAYVVIAGAGNTVCDVEITAGTAQVQSNITITGNVNVLTAFTNDGNITVTGDVIFGSASQVYNSGTVTQTGNLSFLGDPNNRYRSVEHTGTYIINGNLTIGELYFKNFGMMDISGNVLGAGSSSVFLNTGDNAVVKFGGEMFSGNDGVLALSGKNTVEYKGGDQDIKFPDPVQGDYNYHHLILSGSGTKKMEFSSAGNSNTIVQIEGNLTIKDSASFDPAKNFNSYNIELGGNWINTSIHPDPFKEGNSTVTFNGGSAAYSLPDQTITSATEGGETFYNLSIKKYNNNNKVSLNSCHINVTNELTLTSGKIYTGNNNVHVTNSSAAAIHSHTAASYIVGNLKRTWFPSGGSYDFPVGSADAYELANVNVAAANTVNELLVNFSNLPPGTGLPVTDADGFKYTTILNCGGTSYGNGNANDGIWTLTPGAGTAVYDLTLYALNHSNASFNTNTIVTRSNASSPWQFTGAYTPFSGKNPLIVKRTSCNTFGQFAAGARELPFPIQFSTTADSICVWDSVTIAASGGTSYLWNTGETSPSIRVAPLTTTSYKVTISNGGQSTEANQTITVGTPSDAPVITANGNQLTTTATGKAYQWYYNDVLISGATGKDYVLDKTGIYHLVVTNAYGCTSASNKITITSVGVTQLTTVGTLLNIYPNPANGIIFIEIKNNVSPAFAVEIMNNAGQVVYTETIHNCASPCVKTIDLSVFPKGLYFFKAIENNSAQVKKIMLN